MAIGAFMTSLISNQINMTVHSQIEVQTKELENLAREIEQNPECLNSKFALRMLIISSKIREMAPSKSDDFQNRTVRRCKQIESLMRNQLAIKHESRIRKFLEEVRLTCDSISCKEFSSLNKTVKELTSDRKMILLCGVSFGSKLILEECDALLFKASLTIQTRNRIWNANHKTRSSARLSAETSTLSSRSLSSDKPSSIALHAGQVENTVTNKIFLTPKRVSNKKSETSASLSSAKMISLSLFSFSADDHGPIDSQVDQLEILGKEIEQDPGCQWSKYAPRLQELSCRISEVTRAKDLEDVKFNVILDRWEEIINLLKNNMIVSIQSRIRSFAQDINTKSDSMISSDFDSIIETCIKVNEEVRLYVCIANLSSTLKTILSDCELTLKLSLGDVLQRKIFWNKINSVTDYSSHILSTKPSFLLWSLRHAPQFILPPSKNYSSYFIKSFSSDSAFPSTGS